ncbi:MAG: hypothetical protein AAB728_01280, partial [Patescibacteria group bacterium]
MIETQQTAHRSADRRTLLKEHSDAGAVLLFEKDAFRGGGDRLIKLEQELHIFSRGYHIDADRIIVYQFCPREHGGLLLVRGIMAWGIHCNHGY